MDLEILRRRCLWFCCSDVLRCGVISRRLRVVTPNHWLYISRIGISQCTIILLCNRQLVLFTRSILTSRPTLQSTWVVGNVRGSFMSGISGPVCSSASWWSLLYSNLFGHAETHSVSKLWKWLHNNKLRTLTGSGNLFTRENCTDCGERSG